MDVLLIILIILVALIIIFGLRIVKQYERGVVFRLGKARSQVKGPGLRVIIPLVDVMTKVNMRIITIPIPSQKVITKDNVSIDVAAVAYYQVLDATKSLVAIDNVMMAIVQISQTTVRNTVGQHMLDEVLSDTAKINALVRQMVQTTIEQWGVELSRLELKDIQLPETMQRAMAKQAEAEREKRAKIIAASGEFESAEKLGRPPILLMTIQLRCSCEICKC